MTTGSRHDHVKVGTKIVIEGERVVKIIEIRPSAQQPEHKLVFFRSPNGALCREWLDKIVLAEKQS